MNTHLLSRLIAALLLISSLSGCSTQAPRITPGHLDVSEQTIPHMAKITNIIQLSEKEAPEGKVFGGVLLGALIGSTLASGESDSTQDDIAELGSVIGGYVAQKKYGKTIYRLTLALDDKSIKEVYVRGGHYILGKQAKITLHKKSGDITSFLLVSPS